MHSWRQISHSLRQVRAYNCFPTYNALSDLFTAIFVFHSNLSLLFKIMLGTCSLTLFQIMYSDNIQALDV